MSTLAIPFRPFPDFPGRMTMVLVRTAVFVARISYISLVCSDLALRGGMQDSPGFVRTSTEHIEVPWLWTRKGSTNGYIRQLQTGCYFILEIALPGTFCSCQASLNRDKCRGSFSRFTGTPGPYVIFLCSRSMFQARNVMGIENAMDKHHRTAP